MQILTVALAPSRALALVQAVVVTAAILVFRPFVLAGQAPLQAFDPDRLRTGEIIRYRDLSRGDFLASNPPASSGSLHGEVGAATCVSLTTDPDTSIRTSSLAFDGQRTLVRAQVENLGFIAFMDRGCSWWNPGPVSLPDEYILQHEQIHFALVEIAARHLNSRVPGLTRQVENVSTSRQGALEQIQQHVAREMQRVLDEALARSDDFDRDTSRTYSPDRQNGWWQTVTRELNRSAAADESS